MHTTLKNGIAMKMITNGLVLALMSSLMAPAQANNPVLEEVIVTAQKRDLNMQKMPVAVSVISSEDIMNRSIVEFGETLTQIPNTYLHQYSPVYPIVSIRGVTNNSLNAGSEQGVGIAVDEVYLGRSSMFSSSLIDVERVEVLRGPQGTLSGKNTIGGLINVVTRKPSMEFEGGADLTLGDYELKQLRGYVSGPLLEDQVAGKLAFTVKKQDGWTENRTEGAEDLEATDFSGLRGQLLGMFGADNSWLLSAEYSEDENDGFASDILYGDLSEYDDDPWDRSIGTTGVDYFERETYGLSLQVNWRWLDVDLVSITASRGADFEFQDDYDRTPLRLVGLNRSQDQHQFSQELRVSGEGEKHSWLAGLYYFQEQLDATDNISFGADLPAQVFGIAIPGYYEDSTMIATLESQSVAAFVSGTWNFARQWELTAGARVTADEKDFAFEQVTTDSPLVPVIGGIYPEIAMSEDSISDTQWSGDIALTYALTDDMSTYLRLATGYKGAGLAVFVAQDIAPENRRIDAESVLTIEWGYKSQWLNNRLRFNAAVFYSDFEDKQELVESDAGIGVSEAQATIKGLELEFTALTTNNLTLGATLGYQDAIYDDFYNPLTGEDYSGNQLSVTPEYTASAFGQFDYLMSNGWNWLARVDANYRDDIHLNASNDDTFLSTSYTSVNARLDFTSPAATYGVALWIKNALDEDPTLGRFYFGAVNTSYVRLGAPRMWGVELRIKF
jgi:iron complex outermembrane receptor protein